MDLLLTGKLNKYLHEFNEECYEMFDSIVEQMKKKQGVTEELKRMDRLERVRRVNNIMACAEEIVTREEVYV